MSFDTLAIIQARMNSSRLPGKVLMEVAGQPILSHQIRRVEKSKSVKNIVIATTISRSDDAIENLADRLGVGCFRGSESDVLSRFAGVARMVHADIYIRLTADCPLIDAEILDQVVTLLVNQSTKYDYASNVLKRTYPRGLDVEAFFGDTLFRLDRLAITKEDREHVTTYLRIRRPELFACCSLEDEQDNSDLRWTLDAHLDFEVLSRIINWMNLSDPYAPYKEILKFVRAHPELAQMNSDVHTWEPTQNNI